MRFLIGSAFAAFALLSTPAQAQSADRTLAGRAIMQACAQSPDWGANHPNVQVYCACSTGYVSSEMTDRQFYIVGRVAPYFGANDPQGMQAEIAQMANEGYDPTEVQTAGQMLIDMSNAVEATCARL